MKSAILTRGGSNRPDSASGKLAWRGRTVRGNRGEAIGKIEEIYVADETAAPDWALVRGDGPGAGASFLPLRRSRSEGNEVIVPFTRAQVTHAPHNEQGRRLSSEQEAALYDYYGISKADRSPSEARPVGAWEMVVAAEQKLTVQLSHAWQQWLSDLRGRSEAARSATPPASRQRRSAHAKPRQGERHEDGKQR
jgi:PRC-barrel domain